MYVWLWRHLPGPLALRVVQCLVLIAGVTAVLMLVVFPTVEPLLPYQDVTVAPTPSTAPTPQVTASP